MAQFTEQAHPEASPPDIEAQNLTQLAPEPARSEVQRSPRGDGSQNGRLPGLWRQRRWQEFPLGTALVIALLAGLPFIGSGFTVSVFGQVLAFAVLALSLHLLMGWTGMISLGQAGYFGVGAYAAGLLATNHSTSAPLLLLVGASMGGVAAALTGLPVVRSHGGYLLMITIAIGELLARAAEGWVGLTGGDDGLAGIPFTTVGSTALIESDQRYWLSFITLLVCLGVVYGIGRSPFGRSLRGIRDNEPRMRSLGYSTRVYKFVAFTIAGALAGIAGALWVGHNQYVSPHDLALTTSAMVFVAVAIGGSRRLWGPIVGAGVVIISKDMLPSFLEGRAALVLGLILIVGVYVLPGGLTALPQRVCRMRVYRALVRLRAQPEVGA